MNYSLERKEKSGLHGEMNYNFIEQNNNPRRKQAEVICKKYWQEEGFDVIDVSENPSYFHRGDIIKKLGNEEEVVEVKYDAWAIQTGNIPFELIEKAEIGGGTKLGWGYKIGIHQMNFVLFEESIAKSIIFTTREDIKEAAFSKDFKGFASYHPRERYYTLGVLIPYQEIKNIKIIELN